MIEQDFENLLMANSSAPGGVHGMILPNEPTLPAVSYSFISATPSATFDGHGTARYRVEVNCWGASYSDAVTLRHDLIQALDGYSANGLATRLISPHDFFDSAARQYRAMVEFYLFSSI